MYDEIITEQEAAEFGCPVEWVAARRSDDEQV